MADFKETSIDLLSVDNHATFCSSETKWINKILKLKEAYPDKVDIRYRPEDNDGMIVSHIPKSWIKVSPPRKRNMTEEQRVALAERLAFARSKRSEIDDEDEDEEDA